MIRVNHTPFAFDADPVPGDVIVLDATKFPPTEITRISVQASQNIRTALTRQEEIASTGVGDMGGNLSMGMRPMDPEHESKIGRFDQIEKVLRATRIVSADPIVIANMKDALEVLSLLRAQVVP